MTMTMTGSTVTESSTGDNPDAQITINGKALPWQEVFGQLQLFGKLRPFIQDIVSQQILMQEVAARSDLDVDPAELDQRILEFREKQKLTEEEAMRTWLQREQIDYQGFRSRIYFNLKLRKLKQCITEPDLQAEYAARASSFEQVELSYLISSTHEAAASWHEQLQSGTTSFLNLESQAGTNADLKVKAPAAPIRRSWLPTELQKVLQSAKTFDIHGPLAIGEQWMVVRLERVIAPSLDERVERQLRDELFGRWLREKLSGLRIQLG